jgi:predicted glycosyl hydrolase (DUF1957 family)
MEYNAVEAVKSQPKFWRNIVSIFRAEEYAEKETR